MQCQDSRIYQVYTFYQWYEGTPVGGRLRATSSVTDEPRYEKKFTAYTLHNDEGPKLAYNCSYLRVFLGSTSPKLNVPELNVPRKGERCAKSGEEDQHGNKTAGPQEERYKRDN
jgi:hypothetical protein